MTRLCRGEGRLCPGGTPWTTHRSGAGDERAGVRRRQTHHVLTQLPTHRDSLSRLKCHAWSPSATRRWMHRSRSLTYAIISPWRAPRSRAKAHQSRYPYADRPPRPKPVREREWARSGDLLHCSIPLRCDSLLPAPSDAIAGTASAQPAHS